MVFFPERVQAMQGAIAGIGGSEPFYCHLSNRLTKYSSVVQYSIAIVCNGGHVCGN